MCTYVRSAVRSCQNCAFISASDLPSICSAMTCTSHAVFRATEAYSCLFVFVCWHNHENRVSGGKKTAYLYFFKHILCHFGHCPDAWITLIWISTPPDDVSHDAEILVKVARHWGGVTSCYSCI